MASVHESLYFNPMMTNGVVHANVFGIKDWVTPYKIAVLVLLNEMSRTGEGAVSLMERRRLNQLLLPLLQGPDITLSKLYKLIEESCPQLANSVQIRIKLMAEGELKDMEQFFDDLSDSFSGTEPEVHKTSVVGLFLRHMILAYSKLSFSQVFKLYTALQQYFQNGEKKTVEDADMELTSRDEGERKMEKEELDVSVREEEVSCSGPLSQKQAEFFLSQQASLLKNDETKALTPASLQKELNNLLKFNPDFAEAHYLGYLNNPAVQDVVSSTHSLLRVFWIGSGFIYWSMQASSGLLGYELRHGQQAELALQEAIRIAQESNDHVCLQHCLSWLYVLGQKRSDSYVLLEHSVKKAVHFGLPYLASLGIQSLVQQRAFAGKTANKLMDALKDSDLLHWKHSLSELIDISIAQKTAIWRLYGRSTMALQQAQMLLSMNSLEAVNAGVQQNNTESFAVALCHLAELHAEQGCFAAASEVLKHLKERFPPNSQHAQVICLLHGIRFISDNNSFYYNIKNLSKDVYKKAVVLQAQNQMSEAHKLLQKLLVHCQKLKNTEMVISVLLSVAELYWRSSSPTIALPMLLQALALSKEYRLQYLASETVLNLAFAQVNHAIALQIGGKAFSLSSSNVMLAVERIRDVVYFQARLYHTLGKTQERNRCAMLFRQLHQELPSHGVPLINHL
uniref:Anaphase-promoting complex subunit 5 n=1 Tax=Cercocebus atys TaxID=9531 RepID=A0A2K5N2D2_CERAT